jgi:hypothetical protein
VWDRERKIALLKEALTLCEREIERLNKALEAIRDAPGGGPGRRIAAQALDKLN